MVTDGLRSARILVVDDEVVIQALLTEILTEEGYRVALAGDGKRAIDLLNREPFDLVITDIVMPHANGVEVLLAAKRLDPALPVVMITGYPSVNTAVRLASLGAVDYITKPFHTDLIKVTVAKVLEMRRVQDRARGLGVDGPVVAAGMADVCNAAVFAQFFQTEIDRSRWRGYVCSLLMTEIDNFQDTRDARGSQSEKLLEAMVTATKHAMRPGDFIGRTDEAELSVVLPETGPEEAGSLGQQILKEAAWVLSANAAVVCFPRDGCDAGDLIRTARDSVQTARSKIGDVIRLND